MDVVVMTGEEVRMRIKWRLVPPGEPSWRMRRRPLAKS